MSTKLGFLSLLAAALAVLHGTGPVLVAQTDDSTAQERLVDHAPEGEAGGNARSEDPNAHVSAQLHAGRDNPMDCVRCHGSLPASESPDATKLVAPVPQLCFACHEEYATLDGWVHGPVAAGDCLSCHNPHLTKYKSLLRQPMPALCHECHTMETLRSVEGHSDASYSRCSTCHESHAGANRTLLKQKFLASEAGSSYRDEEALRRRPYVFVDQRTSLAGLRGIRVIPAIERQELLARYGVTPEIVKTEVERRLRARGFRILSDEGNAAGQSGLYVCLRMVELRFPAYSTEVCALSGSLSLFLRQTVELVRQPDGMERRLCLATTWDTSAVVVWGTPGIQEGLSNGVEVLVDRFSCDYLAVNPSELPPLSGNDTSESGG